MRTLIRFLSASFLGAGSGIVGILVGGAMGIVVTFLFYVAQILLSLKPFKGAGPADISSAILDSASFGLWAIAVGAALGGLAGFTRVFGGVFSRRRMRRDDELPEG